MSKSDVEELGSLAAEALTTFVKATDGKFAAGIIVATPTGFIVITNLQPGQQHRFLQEAAGSQSPANLDKQWEGTVVVDGKSGKTLGILPDEPPQPPAAPSFSNN